MLIGYARTSTVEQVAGLEAQIRDLQSAGAEKLFSERVSSVASRPQLQAALDFSREGDVLLVTKLDRLARSIEDLVGITKRLVEKSVALKVLHMNLDSSTPTGKLMLNLLGSIAQFERELMLERQREGIARAKAEGRYKGRTPTARRKTAQVKAMAAQGHTKSEIAEALGISERSVYRALSAESRVPFND